MDEAYERLPDVGFTAVGISSVLKGVTSMKIRAVANGNEFEADDDAAKELIATGDYEKAEKKTAKASPTAVAPLTTQDIPRQRKRRKSG